MNDNEQIKRIQWSERQNGTATIYGTWGVVEILTGKELGMLNFAVLQALKAIEAEREKAKNAKGNGIQESVSVSPEERGSIESVSGSDHRGGSEERIGISEEKESEPQEGEGRVLVGQ